jgi:choice-of-anchor B domain-containing protein
MRPAMAHFTRWLLVTVAVAVLQQTEVWSQYVDPPLGSHCACSGGICPLDRNGRACSCGCGRKTNSQSTQRLEAVLDSVCTEGMAAGFPCRDVDLLALLPHGDIGGGSGNDLWGWTDPQTGREYALVGRSSGTAFVDISNPRTPIYLGNLPTHTADSIWRGIKVFADHAFIVSEAANHGMQVFDLRQLRAVQSPPVTFEETAHYAGFGSTHTLALNTQTGFAYAVGTRTCEGGLHAVDVRDPAVPKTAGCFSLDGYTHETQCVLYTGPDADYRDREVCFNSNEDTLTIVDVTDKHAQRQLARVGYGGSSYTHQGWLTGDQRFLLVNDEGDERAFAHPTRTWIWDVSDLDAPALVAKYDGPTSAIDHNLYVRGNLVYESNYRSGLRVLNADGIANGQLTEVGFFDIYPQDDSPAFNGAWTSYPFFASGSVAVNGIEQGLFVLRPRVQPQGAATGLSVTIGEGDDPAPADREWTYLVTVSNHGPGRLANARVVEMPPGESRIVTARASQGACEIGAVATCELGALAAGSDAFVAVTIRPSGEGDFVNTAVATATDAAGAVHEVSAIATTRGVRYEPTLVLHRPLDGATFRVGRNNTVQWTLRGVNGGLRIELSRDGGGNWTTLSENAPNTGFFDWTAAGAPTTRARIRLTSVIRPDLRQTSSDFTIGNR